MAMLVSAVFTIAKLATQIRSLLTEEQIKAQASHTVGQHSASTKKGIVSLAAKCVGLEVLVLGDVSQTHKDEDHAFAFMSGNCKEK